MALRDSPMHWVGYKGGDIGGFEAGWYIFTQGVQKEGAAPDFGKAREMLELAKEVRTEQEFADQTRAAIYRSAQRGALEAVKLLLEFGVPAVPASKNFPLPFNIACQGGHLAVAQTLLAAGADLNGVGYSRRTALHDATWARKPDAVKWLLEQKGIDMSLLDEWGYTALDIAKGNGTADIVALLQKAGCPENDPVGKRKAAEAKAAAEGAGAGAAGTAAAAASSEQKATAIEAGAGASADAKSPGAAGASSESASAGAAGGSAGSASASGGSTTTAASAAGAGAASAASKA